MEVQFTVSDFLKMNLDELYDHLVTLAMYDPNASATISELKKSERYHSSYEFRVMVDFAKLMQIRYVEPSKALEIIVDLMDLIERASALEMWQIVATSWNYMGATYMRVAIHVKAVECFSHAIRVETEHGLFKISSVAYLNAVKIISEVEDADQVLNYLDRALILLEEHKDEIPRFWTHYFNIHAWYVELLLRKRWYKSQEQVKFYFDRLMSVPEDQVPLPIKTMNVVAEFYYAFFFYDEEAFEEVFQRQKSLLHSRDSVILYHQAIGLCKELGRDPERYIKEIIEVEETGVSHIPFVNTYTYRVLMEFYKDKGNEEKLKEMQIKFIDNVEKYLEELSDQHIHSLRTVEQLVLGKDYRTADNAESVEFRLMAEETLKIKRELEEKNAILARISSMDGLTQISSRRDFEERFREMLVQAKRRKTSVAVFMVDIDYFKKYNDTYGHLEGDEVLKRVARVFHDCLDSAGALSARFGGEEFIGAGSHLTLEQVEEIAQGICSRIRGLGIEHSGSPENTVTVSVGVVFSKVADLEMKSDLMKLADECLYEAKNTGKDRFVLKVIG